MFKENFEPDVYRDNLAEEIKEAPKEPKEERQQILDIAKETPEYQIARNKKIEGRQNEEEINNGEGVFIKKKTLYHGSAMKGIKQFIPAEETTVGEGIYFTSQAKDAIGYAIRRFKIRGENLNNAAPTIYESTVEKLKLLDLRKEQNVKNVLSGFYKILCREIKKEGYQYNMQQILLNAMKLIRSEGVGVGEVACITQCGLGGLFTDYIKNLKYDGLITVEGGEGDEIKNHDSYVIFDPEKVKIIREQKIKKEKEDK